MPLSSPCSCCPLRLSSSCHHFPVALFDCCVFGPCTINAHHHCPCRGQTHTTYAHPCHLNLIVVPASSPPSLPQFRHLVVIRSFLLWFPPSSSLPHLLSPKLSSLSLIMPIWGQSAKTHHQLVDCHLFCLHTWLVIPVLPYLAKAPTMPRPASA